MFSVWCRRTIAVSLAVSLDLSLTLAGQSNEYWAGDRDIVLEANPLAAQLLAISPLAMIFAAMAWIAIVALLMSRLPDRYSRRIAWIVTAAHWIGASTWLIQYRFGAAWVIVLWCLVIGFAEAKLVRQS